MCGYFCIGFVDFMLKGKVYESIQICFIKIFLSNLRVYEYEINGKVILKYFQ